MSPTIKTTYSRQEIRENREAFRDWKWIAGAVEPDGRVTVLAPAHHAQEMRGFLCRCQHGWFWVAGAAELAEKAERETPYSWNAATRDLGGDAMRVPTEQELDMGGFRITVDPEPEEYPQDEDDDQQEPAPDEAKEQIDAGFRSLDMMDLHGTGAPARRAQAHFMAAIAISLYDLVALHKKYDVDNLRVEVDPGPAVEREKTAIDTVAKESLPEGHVIDEVGGVDFPWAR